MKFPDIRKQPWKNIDIMISGLINMIQGFVLFASLGFIYLSIDMSYYIWRNSRMYKDYEDYSKRPY